MPSQHPYGAELQRLIELLSKVPGLGPRSARRAALGLIKRKDTLMEPLAAAIGAAARSVRPCTNCGNLDTREPCAICADPGRDKRTICVVEEVSDVWALERAGVYKGLYHVLGGVLSAIDGIGPEGDHLHSAREYCRVATIAPRAQNVALFLHRLASGEIWFPR